MHFSIILIVIVFRNGSCIFLKFFLLQIKSCNVVIHLVADLFG